MIFSPFLGRNAGNEVHGLHPELRESIRSTVIAAHFVAILSMSGLMISLAATMNTAFADSIAKRTPIMQQVRIQSGDLFKSAFHALIRTRMIPAGGHSFGASETSPAVKNFAVGGSFLALIAFLVSGAVGCFRIMRRFHREAFPTLSRL